MFRVCQLKSWTKVNLNYIFNVILQKNDKIDSLYSLNQSNYFCLVKACTQ